MNIEPIKISATSIQRLGEVVVGVHYTAVVASDNGIAHTRGMVLIDGETDVSKLDKAQLDAYVVSKVNVPELEQHLRSQIPEPVQEIARIGH